MIPTIISAHTHRKPTNNGVQPERRGGIFLVSHKHICQNLSDLNFYRTNVKFVSALFRAQSAQLFDSLTHSLSFCDVGRGFLLFATFSLSISIIFAFSSMRSKGTEDSVCFVASSSERAYFTDISGRR